MSLIELDKLIQSASETEASKRVIRVLSHDHVEACRNVFRLSPDRFFDSFARRVAHEYWVQNLSFEAADTAMNALHAYVGARYDVRLPAYAGEVFAAFDQGEFHHKEDDESVDPEEKYTKPEIRSIVLRDEVLGASIP